MLVSFALAFVLMLGWQVQRHIANKARLTLRNLGYDVRPPMMETYDWNGDTPFDAQRITAALITTNRRSYVLNGIGTGKTRSVLYAYDYLKKAADTYGKLLVTAPLSTLRQTWEREVAMVFPHLKVAVLHGHNKAKRIKQMNLAADMLR